MHRAISMEKEEFTAWNEQMAKQYDPEHYHESANRIVRFVERRRVKCILKLLKAKPESRVLEVGVGAGNILQQIPSAHRAGLDLSAFLLEKARRRLGPDVTLVEGDAEDLAKHFAPKSFDRIFCSEVLEHVQHPDRVLAEMARCVTDDGIVVVSVPNEGFINSIKAILKSVGIFRLLFPDMADHMEDEWHLHVFGRQFLADLARKHFVIERIASAPLPFMPIRLIACLTPRKDVLDMDGMLKVAAHTHTRTGVPVYLDPAATAEMNALKNDEGNALKNFFKQWPALYSVLFAVVGPSLQTGLTSPKFIKRLQKGSVSLYAGSGPRRINDSTVNVDIMPFAGVDIVADLAHLPFNDGVFDAVSCEQVLEHVPGAAAVAHELLRVTKPGGLIHVASPFVFPWHPSPLDFNRWTLEGLEKLFVGCETVERGVTAGPFSALTAQIACTFAVLLSCGSRKLLDILQYVFLVLLIPLKLLDLIAAHLPGSELCAANLYVVVRKS